MTSEETMESQEFIVLYTHQKMKKSKVWQDGILKIAHVGNKAVLYDDKGECLDSLFLKGLEVKPGDDLESERYLIIVEDVKVAENIAVKQDVVTEAPESSSTRFIPSGRSLGCQPSGLKRKFTGFQGPHQVPKKMVITENGESAVCFEAQKPGRCSLSPFYSTPPLFAAAGRRDTDDITVPEDTAIYKSGERGGQLFSSAASTPSSVINQEMLCEENHFCSPVRSIIKHSGSLLTSEPTKRDSLVPPCLGISQNIRSKAQILALLKSESAGMSMGVNSEIAEHMPQVQPQGGLTVAAKLSFLIDREECAAVRTEGLHYQHPSESSTRNRSQWAVHSPSSPVHSTAGGNDPERKPMVQGDNVNLKDPLIQKRIQLLETYAENGKMYNEDKLLAGNNYQSWNQEVKAEITLFCESNSSPITCGDVENGGSLSESDIQENTELPVHQNDQMCIKGSVLTRENAQEIHLGRKPGKEYKQTVSYLPGSERVQIESLSNGSRMPDAITDMFSESNTDGEIVTSIHEPMNNVTPPVLEVTFNLNHFETSDTEEESQESNRISQDSECWVKDNPGVQKRCEDFSCEEVGTEHSPLLTSTGSKSTETFPIEETLPSQFCGQTCVGFDTGPWEAGATGEEVEEVGSSFASALEWTGDAGHEDANQFVQKVRTNDDFALLPSKSKGVNPNLYLPHFLNVATNQNAENRPFSEQPQPFVMGGDLAESGDQVSPATSGSDSRVQLLQSSQNHSEEGITLDQSNPQVPSSLFCPLGRKHPVFKEAEAHFAESEDLRGIILSHDHTGVDTVGESRQHWTSPRDSSERSGLVNSISLLKSLSEHSTALEGLEVLKKKTTFKQGSLQTQEPGNSPEEVICDLNQFRTSRQPQQHRTVSESGKNDETTGNPWISVTSQAELVCPHPNQDSQQCSTPMMIKENEVEPTELLQCLQPVEFQGHQVQGSAHGAVMVRGHGSQLERGQCPADAEHKSCTTELPSAYLQADILQVMSPEQKMSMLSPVSTFYLDPRDEDFILEFSEESLRARTFPVMKKFSSVQHRNYRPPCARRARIPVTTGPPDSRATDCDRQEAPGPPRSSLCEDSAAPTLCFGPEEPRGAASSLASGAGTPGGASWLHNVHSQSKWLKYQNTPPCDLGAAGPARGAQAKSGVRTADSGGRQRGAEKEGSWDSVRVQMIKGMLHEQRPCLGRRDPVCRNSAFSLGFRQASETKEIPAVLGESTSCERHALGEQEISVSELCFPRGQKIQSAYFPRRQAHIPAVFQSPAHYKQIFTSCLIEHLNILLFGLAQRLHRALAKVDISFYTSSKGDRLENLENTVPSCRHNQPAKLVAVHKEGPNKGRLFYTCDAPKADRCKFFKWLEEVTPGKLTQETSSHSVVLSDIKSVGVYLRSQNIPVYEECQLLVRKGFDFQSKRYGKIKKFTTVNPEFCNEPKSKLYLKLSRKESASTYSKDDLWVISKTLDFQLDTFIACSAFFGPSSASEVELLPLKGYFPSNWPTNTVVHALLVCNASTELTTLKNIEDHFSPATLPLTQCLLTASWSTTVSKRVDKRKFIPPAFSDVSTALGAPSLAAALQLASELVRAHALNEDQATALTQVAQMMAAHDGSSAGEVSGSHTQLPPVTVIQGVFGAGKSYLLAVVILFFVQLFEKNEAPAVGSSRPWKLLISSSTNVAVDRVLLGLLSLGFEKFVRVGSVRKIAKPVLPYSLHAGSENTNEQLKELHALMKEDLTPVEKVCVRKSIEQHKLGTNKTLLKQVRVVGVTCAACPFPCLNDLKFPVVLLDESSQITEPASLLPIARFGCEKLVLVGDPKQLPPTIQGSEAAHERGLEQTLFDRLCLMGHKPVVLRTQYRCHPAISAVANDLFYAGNLRDGVSEADRGPLLDWLPTLCFYDVQGVEQVERDNSFHNVAEAAFTLKLIQSLIASGVAGSVIGVITLYKSQMHKICEALRALDAGQPAIRAVQVSTVDAFQGAEKEVIVLSCVRTRQVGFIDSEKRMNVALTRGRRHLLIVGHLACLRKNRLWGRVIQHCQGREDGLQPASQCEAQLNRLLKDYFEKQAEEKQKKRSEKDKSKDKSQLQEGVV